MRTTLDIDPDVLQAAKEIAARSGSTAGKVLSRLARRALEAPQDAAAMRHGVPLLAPRDGETPVTLDAVNRLRDQG